MLKHQACGASWSPSAEAAGPMTEPDGVVSLSRRFENIENVLLRIETKLDSKVDVRAHSELTRRVELLETGDTPLGKYMLKEFAATQQQVADLTLHGSRNAQQLASDLEELRGTVNMLSEAGSGARATIRDRQERQNKAFKTWAIVISLVSAASVTISTALAIVLATN